MVIVKRISPDVVELQDTQVEGSSTMSIKILAQTLGISWITVSKNNHLRYGYPFYKVDGQNSLWKIFIPEFNDVVLLECDLFGEKIFEFNLEEFEEL